PFTCGLLMSAIYRSLIVTPCPERRLLQRLRLPSREAQRIPKYFVFESRQNGQHEFYDRAFLYYFDILLLCSFGVLRQVAVSHYPSLLGRNGWGDPSPVAIRR